MPKSTHPAETPTKVIFATYHPEHGWVMGLPCFDMTREEWFACDEALRKIALQNKVFTVSEGA